MRQQVYELDGYTIIDDSYNANPDSMKAGIRVFYYDTNSSSLSIFLAALLPLD